MTFSEWFKKKYGVSVSDDLYFKDKLAASEFDKYLKEHGGSYDDYLKQNSNS